MPALPKNFGGDSLEENFVLNGPPSPTHSAYSCDSPVRKRKRPAEETPAQKKKKAKRIAAEIAAKAAERAATGPLDASEMLVAALKSHKPVLSPVEIKTLTIPDTNVVGTHEGDWDAIAKHARDGEGCRVIVLVSAAERGFVLWKKFKDANLPEPVVPLYNAGGGKKKDQLGRNKAQLERGHCAVIGTPGRVLTMLQEKALSFSKETLVVVDAWKNQKLMRLLDIFETRNDFLEIIHKHLQRAVKKQNAKFTIC